MCAIMKDAVDVWITQHSDSFLAETVLQRIDEDW